MSQIGLTRRIDELGRVVIPKEIRKKLHLRPGELLEINIQNDILTLKKYDTLNNDTYLNLLFETLKGFIKDDIYLTNLNEIIYSTNNLFVGRSIDDNIENLISSNKDKQSNIYKKYQILANGDLIGFLIISTSNSEILINFIIKLIEKYYENM